MGTRASAGPAGPLAPPSRSSPTLPLLRGALSSSLLNRSPPVHPTPSTVVETEVARVPPLPLPITTSSSSARSLKLTTHMSPEQQQTTRIVDTTLPPSTQLPPSPATTTCLPMTKMP